MLTVVLMSPKLVDGYLEEPVNRKVKAGSWENGNRGA